MKAAFLSKRDAWLVPVLLIMFVFFIPISTSLRSIFLVFCIVSILLDTHCRAYLSLTFNSLWGWAALGLLVFTLLACFWSTAPFSKSMVVVSKYTKLLYLPIFAVAFLKPQVRHWCIHAYLASMLLTCILSILIHLNLLMPGHDDPGKVFNNHIITGFMMAFAVYLSGLFAIQYPGWKRAAYLLLCILMSYQVLFINVGRTGYVIYFMLMVLLFLQKMTFKKAIVGILLFSLGFTLVYFENKTMQDKIHQLVTDVQNLQQNQLNTSLGYRIQFHRYAKSLWLQHPLLGNGTGSFKESFYRDDPVPSWGRGLTDPHSQYWMILSEQGFVGLLFLVLFILSLFISSLQLAKTRPIILGLLIAFCIGSFTDTILCYSTLGFLLVIMGSLCFGELIENHAQIEFDSKNVGESWLLMNLSK